jgi:hypothetical protein
MIEHLSIVRAAWVAVRGMIILRYYFVNQKNGLQQCAWMQGSRTPQTANVTVISERYRSLLAPLRTDGR